MIIDFTIELNPCEQGLQAYTRGKNRDKNPYTVLAIEWDKGWCRRQAELLSDRERRTGGERTLSDFAEFLTNNYREDLENE